VSYDGLTLASQTPQTQQLFLGTFGGRANEVWVLEHNAELVAAGFPIPTPSQSGAQVSSASDDNENEGNDNGSNDNRNNDNSDRNDNGRHNDNR
jgi:hypothetical protein